MIHRTWSGVAVAAFLTGVTVGVPVNSSGSVAHPCMGHNATIVGTAGRDVLVGTAGSDVIVGLGGADEIHGLRGDDVICGGAQGDELGGGRGDDSLYGGSQDSRDPDLPGDLLSGGAGDDLLAPQRAGRTDYIDYTSSPRAVHVKRNVVRGEGLDRLVRDVPAMILLSKQHNDSYIGTAAKDLVWAEGGDDTVRTRAADDWVFFNDHPGGGLDRAWLGRGNDSVWGWSDRLSVRAGSGNDEITGGPLGGPHVEGGPGADTVSFDVQLADSEGADGGTGVDTLGYQAGPISSWDMATGEAHVGQSDAVVLFTGFENGEFYSWNTPSLLVTGTAGANSFVVRNVATTFLGMEGDDRFLGSEFVDTFDGGPGTDEYTDDRKPGGGNGCVSVEVDLLHACSP